MNRQYEGPHLPPQPAPHTPPPDDGGSALRPLDPRVLRLWWTTAALTVVVVLVAAAAAGMALPDGWGGLPPLVAFVGGTPLAAAVPWLRYRRWRFALRDRDLWIRHGVLWVHTSVIPYSRLQFVDTTQGPLDRLFGLSQLVVHTASPGTSGVLPGLALDEAEALRERLSHAGAATRDA